MSPSRANLLLIALCSARTVAAGGVVDPAANLEWLALNKDSNADVVELPSGLQFKVLASGDPTAIKPSAGDKCTCHYEGTLIDGSVFDSSRKRGKPATFSPNGVIAGWTEALQLMRPGDRWMLYIPAELGYGARGAGGRIPGGATLIFDLELLSIAESKGLFAGTPLDTDIIGPLKVWHVLLAVVGLLVYFFYVDSIFSGGGGGRQVSASHILVKDDQLEVLEELKTRLIAGKADFAAMAKEHSTCPSAARGGALGTFGPGQMVAAFDKVCWEAPVGEVQGPVQTQFGYHLILVTERDAEDKKKS